MKFDVEHLVRRDYTFRDLRFKWPDSDTQTLSDRLFRVYQIVFLDLGLQTVSTSVYKPGEAGFLNLSNRGLLFVPKEEPNLVKVFRSAHALAHMALGHEPILRGNLVRDFIGNDGLVDFNNTHHYQAEELAKIILKGRLMSVAGSLNFKV